MRGDPRGIEKLKVGPTKLKGDLAKLKWGLKKLKVCPIKLKGGFAKMKWAPQSYKEPPQS